MTQRIMHGGAPILPDPRDDNFTEIAFGAATLPKFPKTLNRVRRPVKNQRSSLSCTAQAATLASEYQEGIALSAEWQWRKITEELGTYSPNGASPRVAFSTLCEFGSLPQEFSRYSFETDSPEVIGNWHNWPFLDDKAEQYKKAAYVRIPLVGDYFDSIRAALVWGLKEKKIVVPCGQWLNNWDQPFIPKYEGTLSGWHAFTFIDFDTIEGIEYLIIQNSYGTNWADDGFQYMPREVVNREFAKYGTGLFVFVDLTPEQINLAKQESVFGRIQRAILQIWAQVMIVYGSTDQTLPLMQRLIALLSQLRDLYLAPKPPVTPPKPVDPPVKPPVPLKPPVVPSKTLSQKLYDAAYASQGKDLSITAPNEVGCAESLSKVIRMVLPGFPIMLSTTILNAYIAKDPRFAKIAVPEKGCVTIFPTKGKTIGHCGVWGKNSVMSNNSPDGKWRPNYTHKSWSAAAKARGLPLYHYRLR